MYENFYGLSGKPFSLLPDGDSIFPSRRHRRAMTLLDYGLLTKAGFVVITGEVGAGKTTVIRRFLKNARDKVAIGVITNPSTSTGHLFDWIALAFDIKARDATPTALYDAILAFLLDQYAHGKHTVLVVDEAQNLTAAMLEDLRMLSNVNNEHDMLLQIVLVGQPELMDTLKQPALRQFVQRITVHCHLDPLSAEETAAYIRYRLGRVGGRKDIFDDLACAAVHYFSGGVPRLINLLCDLSLVYGFSEDMPNISFDTVAEVAFERSSFGLSAFAHASQPLPPETLKNNLRDILAAIQHNRPVSSSSR